MSPNRADVAIREAASRLLTAFSTSVPARKIC